MSESNGTKEVPASRNLLRLIQRELADIIEQGAKDADLPAGAQLDIQRGVWVLPKPEPVEP